MNPGKFRDRITFNKFVKNADGYGGYTYTAGGTVETIWGYIIPESGELINNNGKRSKQKVKKLIIRKKDWDLISNTVSVDNNDINFSIYGESGDYRINDAFESTPDEYITITGTMQL